MVKRDFERVVSQIRLDSKRRALQQALLVPWRTLAETASAYLEWHAFELWVRAIVECEHGIPEIVRTALASRCPGFLEDEMGQSNRSAYDSNRLWHSLEDWIAEHEFAEPKKEGWFDAVMYYAYKDLRTEQAWSYWERTRNAWLHDRPSQWPTLEEWNAQVAANHSLAQDKAEKTIAVEALAKVDRARLQRAVSEILESRAFALWVACISKPGRALHELALTELHRRLPEFPLTANVPTIWHKVLFFHLTRYGEHSWRATARTEQWSAALRHQVIHHPRQHRLVHYYHRCMDEWFSAPPQSMPSFAHWLRAADQYVIAPTT